MRKRFDNNTDFSHWLESNNWFQVGYLLDYKVDVSKRAIYLKLAYQIQGTYEANTERTLRVFSVKADGVRDFTPIVAGEWIRDHYIEGIDLKESDAISFTLDVPKPIVIECARVSVVRLSNIVDIVKPWLSENELSVTVHGAKLPTPAEWLQWFSELGHHLVWRYYCGSAKEVSAVPQQEYQGWYLQDMACIAHTSQGLFFFHCRNSDDSFYVSLKRYELSDEIWFSLKKLLLRFDDIQVRCGNCKLNYEQWKNIVVE